jgi:signal transduction histidine kinase
VTAEVVLHVPGSKTVKRGGRQLPDDVWHDLVHEVATIRALTAAALLAPDATGKRRLLTLIERESTEMSDLLRRTRHAGHADRGPVDVISVVRGVVQPLAPTTPAELTILEHKVGLVDIDRISLRRILRNLISNAVRAAEDGRVEIRVGPTATGLEVAIEVADSGPGFGHGQVGLDSQGLSIVAELAAAAGGVLDIGSSDLGGAGVTVTLPVLRAG